jgi:hypothetical protein
MKRNQKRQQARSGPVEALTAELDALVARMNTRVAKRRVAQLFKASPVELGKSAVKAAGRRG